MLRIAVLDDEKCHLETTCRMIKQYISPEDTVDCFETIEAFKTFFEENPLLVDIVVLDICMPESNGIDVAKYIRLYNSKCRIIYLSNYLEFATEVYETDHTFFILKTDVSEKFPIALQRAKKQLDDVKKESVCVKILHGDKMVIHLNNIVYVERFKRKTIINTLEGIVETLENVDEIFGKLEGEKIIRCHRSYWVNPIFIKVITPADIVLIDDRKIPLSRGYNKELKTKFMHYIALNA